MLFTSLSSNTASNLKLFKLVLTFSLPLLQLSFLSVEISQNVTIINDKNHLKSSVPCLQTSLSQTGNLGTCKIYRSFFTDTPQQVSISSTFYACIFCTKVYFWHKNPLLKPKCNQKKLRNYLSYKKSGRILMMKLTGDHFF